MIFSHQDVPSLVGKYPVKMSHLSSGKISGYTCSCLRFMMLTDLNSYKLSALVLMIFSHQDVPSLVGKYPVKISHLSSGKISAYPCSCLLISMVMMLTAFKSYKISAMILMIFSHEDVPSLVG